MIDLKFDYSNALDVISQKDVIGFQDDVSVELEAQGWDALKRKQLEIPDNSS